MNDLSGKIALADRGGCLFINKALYAQRAGAIACIICNINDTTPIMDGIDPEITIPALLLKASDCQMIREALNVGEVIEICLESSTTDVRNIARAVESLSFSPNPVQRGQYVLTDTNFNQNHTYQMFNIGGQLIQTGNIEDGKMEIPKQLDAGIYLITKMEKLIMGG